MRHASPRRRPTWNCRRGWTTSRPEGRWPQMPSTNISAEDPPHVVRNRPYSLSASCSSVRTIRIQPCVSQGADASDTPRKCARLPAALTQRSQRSQRCTKDRAKPLSTTLCTFASFAGGVAGCGGGGGRDVNGRPSGLPFAQRPHPVHTDRAERRPYHEGLAQGRRNISPRKSSRLTRTCVPVAVPRALGCAPGPGVPQNRSAAGTSERLRVRGDEVKR